ncbi:hypothetical protein F4777DRAFT_594734 [Nemania sp. FL0916]|nr:hypothetical protein F4777DRAFT_594734 [Nemania sp. FL0916]
MSFPPSKEVSWAAFPGAVQLPLSEHPIHGYSLDEPAPGSCEWQDAIARHNFERITLTLWRMSEFESMTRYNRESIKCIRLNLELEGDMFEISNTADNCTIIKAIHDLFWILSTWEPEEKLRLEINICSSTNHTLEYKVPQEILDPDSQLFCNDEYKNAWYLPPWMDKLPFWAVFNTLRLI